jgi:hypothetical protein
MKTTIEIPDPIFRRAKAKAAEQGAPLHQFVTEALAEKLRNESRAEEKPWMASAGALRHLRKETARINKIIEEEFERIEQPPATSRPTRL